MKEMVGRQNKTTSKVEAWLRKSCFTAGGFGEGTGGIILKSKDSNSGKQELVKEYPINSDSNLEILSQSIYLDAVEDAEESSTGTIQFTLYAHRSKQRDHFAKKPFRIISDNDEGSPTEGPSERGLLAQNQRHLEVMARINASMVPTMTYAQNTIIDSLVKRLDHMEQTHVETLTLMKDLIQMKNAQEVEMFLSVQRAQRVDTFIEKVTDMAPELIPKLIDSVVGKPDEKDANGKVKK